MLPETAEGPFHSALDLEGLAQGCLHIKREKSASWGSHLGLLEEGWAGGELTLPGPGFLGCLQLPLPARPGFAVTSPLTCLRAGVAQGARTDCVKGERPSPRRRPEFSWDQ